MKINIYKVPDLKENHVDLYYDQVDEATKTVKEYLEAFEGTILGYDEETQREHRVSPGEILYLEIVDRKTYAYLKNHVWRVDYGLQEFLEKYDSTGFVRISKSMLVNIYHIAELKAQMNMRVNILLDNGEQIVLNRGYKNSFYDYLERKVSEA